MDQNDTVVALADLATRRVRLASLAEDPLNARTHDSRNLAGIRSSLQTFGQREPLVVRDGVVVGGNARLRAMRELGWTECWVTDHSDLTEAQARALGVVLNRTAEVGTSWHPENLRLAIETVHLECPTIELDFKPVELAAIMPKPEVTEDEAPEPLPEAKAQRGDIICLGPHKVMCGDSTCAEDVAALLGGVKPGLMVTDPPYGVGYAGSRRPELAAHTVSGKMLHREQAAITNDDRAEWGGAYRGDVAYVWHGALHAHIVRESLEAAGYEIRSQIIWKKPQATMGRSHYWWQHEPCYYAVRKGSASAEWVGETGSTTVWDIMSLAGWGRAHDPDGNANQGHPTQKPVECMARPIRNHGHPDVYDPFLGSGTTLIAADQLGRRCFGMELEPRYIDVIVRRWLAYCAKTNRAPEVVGWRGDA